MKGHSAKIVTPDNMVGVYSVGSTAVHGDTAHIPNSPDKLCRDCFWMRHWWNAKIWGRCAKVAIFRNCELEDIGKIKIDTQACKYFDQRKEGDKPWKGLIRDNHAVGDAGTGVAAAS